MSKKDVLSELAKFSRTLSEVSERRRKLGELYRKKLGELHEVTLEDKLKEVVDLTVERGNFYRKAFGYPWHDEAAVDAAIARVREINDRLSALLKEINT
jgi:hypothetical protein